jgi:hypothetical protein
MPARDFDLDQKTFDGLRYWRVSFNKVEHARETFVRCLRGFTQSIRQAPASLKSTPPLAYPWMGSVQSGGYEPIELPGLVTWDLRCDKREAAHRILSRLLRRWKCSQEQLPLLCSPRLFCRSLPSLNGVPRTRVSVFTHYVKAAELASGLPAGRDQDLHVGPRSSHCAICWDRGHSIWECPCPKIRLRLAAPFNITFRRHLETTLTTAGLQGIKNVWGGRSPLLSLQNRRFGYISFANNKARLCAWEHFTTDWMHQNAVLGILKVDSGLLDECPSCGYSVMEPSGWGTTAHDLGVSKCPNIHAAQQTSFTVDMLQVTPPGSTDVPAFAGARA